MRCAVAPCIRGDHGEAGDHVDAHGRKWSAARVAGMRAQSPEDADAQKQWQDHLRSCAVCYRAADYGGLCNRGQAIWTVIASAPAVALSVDDWAHRVGESGAADLVLVITARLTDDGVDVETGVAVRGGPADPTEAVLDLLDAAKADVAQGMRRARARVIPVAPRKRGDA